MLRQFWYERLMFEKQIKEMQDREEPSEPIFTVKDCGMPEFNGKYYIDTAHNGGFMDGKHCYRKNGIGDAGGECTIEWFARSGSWYMTKNYDVRVYYIVKSNADQPPTSGWEVRGFGMGSPPELVYEGSDVPNFFLLLYE